jgi:hypothetical protein
MNRIRYLAAGLLCLAGVIHVARLGIPESGAAFDTVVFMFGVAYLIIGGFLFRDSKTAYYFGAIVPLIGVCVGIYGGIAGGMLTNPTIWMAFLFTIDIVIVVGCFYLIKQKRSA